MLNYAFLEILESLTRDEIKSFRRFILSPYFNRSQKVLRLFDCIIKYYPNFDNPKLSKEVLHKKISPDLPYNELTMRRLLFDLQNLAEKFMRQIYIEKKEPESKLMAIEELAIRGASRMHKLITRDTEVLLDNEIVDAEQCLNHFKLETEKFYFGMINDKITRKNFIDTEAGKLIKGITYFISYFMLESIKHNETLLNYSLSFKVKHSYKFISQFLELFDLERLEIFMTKHSLAGSYIIKAYLNMLKAFLYFDNDYYYEEFKSSVFDNLEKFSNTDKNFLFAKLSAYCTIKGFDNSVTNKNYDNELFGIYRILVENKYYETEANKYMPVDLYRNILFQASRMKELRWLEEFIEDYSRLIHPNRKTDIINYSYAFLNFERGNFGDSLKWLSKIRMEEFSYHLDIRNMYLRIYYEQGDYESALSSSKAFLKYLNENTIISDDKKQANENLVKFTIKLINYHNTSSKTDPTSLMLQANKCKRLSSKEWLLTKVHELDRSVKKAI
ncbi:MAG: hypothetical protein ABI543_04565 [Ignavibacteria bacterium]